MTSNTSLFLLSLLKVLGENGSVLALYKGKWTGGFFSLLSSGAPKGQDTTFTQAANLP